MTAKKHFVFICLYDFGATLTLHIDFAKSFGADGKIRTEMAIILSELFCDVTSNPNITNTVNSKIGSMVIFNIDRKCPNI